ncbi:hypothetical protein EGT67_08210 [Prescottella agglutinans]|uniref:Secreted protein n=1 Tax=Prescottella agglutinans TaxID=1644129 RepID=A0A438BGP0_9NOCA|nr:hypothetical protein EGT67_08210 [Prescottella agglutinans]
MHTRTRNTLARTVSGVAIAAASVLAVPALATAAPAVSAPEITASAAASSITVTVQNNNTDAGTTCGAYAIVASKMSELEKDPSKLLEPGFAAWKVKPTERVGAASTKAFTTPEFNDGVYAVIGECTSTSSGAAVSRPKIVSLPENAMFGSLENGALKNLVEFLTSGNIDGLIKAISAGSSQAG